jgi:hypothetical protein
MNPQTPDTKILDRHYENLVSIPDDAPRSLVDAYTEYTRAQIALERKRIKEQGR